MSKDKKPNIKMLMFKALCTKNTMIVVLLLASIFCSLLISSAWAVHIASKTKRLENSTTIYGQYQVFINDVDKKLIETILLNEKEIIDYTSFKQTINNNIDGIENIIYANENFFNLAQINLQEGTFPINQKEILIDDLYLFNKGVKSKDIIGEKISIGNNDYTVTGVISNVDFKTEHLVAYTYILDFKSAENTELQSIYIKTSTNNISHLHNKLINYYNINSEQVSFNNNSLQYAGINEKGYTTGIDSTIFRIIILAVGLLSVFLIYTLCVLYIRKTNTTTSILLSAGVSFIQIFSSTIGFLSIIITSTFTVTTIISNIFISLLFKVNIMKNPETLYSAMVLIFCFLIITFFTALFIISKNKTNINANINNVENIKAVKKSKLLSTKFNYLMFSIAKKNLSVMKTKFALYVTVIVLSSILFVISSYLINIFKDTTQNLQDYDFILKFKYNNITEMMEGKKEHEELYKKIKLDFPNNQFSIFNTSTLIGFDKDNISEKHRLYLGNLRTDYEINLNNPITTQMNVPVILLSVDNATLERLGALPEEIVSISYNECLVIKNTIGVMDSNYDVALNIDDNVYITVPLNESEIIQPVYDELDEFEQPPLPIDTKIENIKVKSTIDSINLDIQEFTNLPIIIINEQLFKKINSNNTYPSFVLFDNIPQDNDKIIKSFEGAPSIDLINLIEQNEIANEYLSNIYWSIIFILFILLVFLSLIMIMTTLLRYEESKNQYAILKSLGISSHKVMRIFMYEAIVISATSTLIALPLSIVSTYFAYIFIIANSTFFLYSIPVSIIITPIITLIFISIISYIPVLYKMNKDSIVNMLKHN